MQSMKYLTGDAIQRPSNRDVSFFTCLQAAPEATRCPPPNSTLTVRKPSCREPIPGLNPLFQVLFRLFLGAPDILDPIEVRLLPRPTGPDRNELGTSGRPL